METSDPRPMGGTDPDTLESHRMRLFLPSPGPEWPRPPTCSAGRGGHESIPPGAPKAHRCNGHYCQHSRGNALRWGIVEANASVAAEQLDRRSLGAGKGARKNRRGV